MHGIPQKVLASSDPHRVSLLPQAEEVAGASTTYLINSNGGVCNGNGSGGGRGVLDDPLLQDYLATNRAFKGCWRLKLF